MSRRRKTGLAALGLAMALSWGSAEAGRSCEQRPLSAQSAARPMALGLKSDEIQRIIAVGEAGSLA